MKPAAAGIQRKLIFFFKIDILSEVEPTNRLTKAVDVKLPSSKWNTSFISALCLEEIVAF